MIRISQCYLCRNYRGNFKCAAFPDEIPEDILFNRHDHKQPYPGDKNILFEKADSSDNTGHREDPPADSTKQDVN